VRSPVRRVPLLADDYITVFRSPDPRRVYAYTPGLLRLPSGRLIATLDLGGPGVIELPGPKALRGEGPHAWQGRILISDDDGLSWRETAKFPFFHARPFLAGSSVYVLGHAGDLTIIRSDDEGETWSAPVQFTQNEWWHQSACSVVHARGHVYLVMEKLIGPPNRTKCATLAPVVMAGREEADLTDRAQWRFSEEKMYVELAAGASLIGVPFRSGSGFTPGWLEANLVAVYDPAHPWYDPEFRTFYLFMRAANAPPNLACIARVQEHPDGTMRLTHATMPTGSPIAYIPCPGGHMKFYILYDPLSRLYWLLSSQSTDSFSGPFERHRLALHYSKNLVDWQMAGMVAMGPSPGQARHYASMVVSGDDLLILSRSGTAAAKSAHDGDIISLHRVERFRELVY